MSSKAKIISVSAVAVLVLALVNPAWAASPQGVSPGSVDRVDRITDSCPTFSWGAQPDAGYFEIVAYALDEHQQPDDLQDSDLGEWNQALYAAVPGAASSWTPAADQGLEPGRRYVWFVRGVKSNTADEVIETGEWSRGRFFTVPVEPSARQVHEALQLVQRYLTTHDDLPESQDHVAGELSRSDHTGSAKAAAGAKRSVPTAPAAIIGAHPDISGERYGVVGTSASADGAGLAAVNSAGGADLVLDGSEDTATDTAFSEAGISRSSASAETFAISNPGAGSITLDVNGDLDVVDVSASGTLTGDGSGLSGVVTTESDPVYSADPAAGITGTNITNWSTAFGWGDHSTEGYLTSYTETDPVYSSDPAAGITGTNITNWNTAYGWGNHSAAGYDTTDDPWAGTVSAVWTNAQVGIGLSGPPAFDLHIQRNMPPAIPHIYLDQMGPGDAFTWYTLSMVGTQFAQGVDAADNSFKLTNSPALTSGAGSAQGDGVTIMAAGAAGIVDLNNQSRARAFLNHIQIVPFSVWLPIEYDDDFTPPGGYDQQGEFITWTPVPTPAFFTPMQEGYYQVNARTEIEYLDPAQLNPNGYVSIAIFVNGIPYAEGNNLQMVLPTGDILWYNNAPNVSDVVYLLPGDVVDIRVWQSVEAGPGVVALVTGQHKTYVSIHKSS